MTSMIRTLSATLAGGLLLAVSHGSAVSQQTASIGAVNDVRSDAFGTPPGLDRRMLAVQSGVFANERIETGRNGWAQLRFNDSTDFRVGAGSTIVLDRFVYDPDKKAGELTIGVTEGVFRFVTGTMKSESYRIRTPNALIGVRGTDFLLAVAPDGSLKLAVNSGAVEIIPRVGNRSILVLPENVGTVDSTGTNAETQPVPDSAKGSVEKLVGWFDGAGSLGPMTFDSAGTDAGGNTLSSQTVRGLSVPNIVHSPNVPAGGAMAKPPKPPGGGTFKK
jgi:ferric-dicitrate binding protein FerR (iron transport regulator)